MNPTAPFTIYNASAGSGKTFTLVKEYLKQVLKAPHESYYKHLLAITFTNKAVAEMKKRIIDTLVSFSNPVILTEPSAMANTISEETGIEIQEIHLKSKKILKHLLHNYSAFSVETIDRFNHRLIRTFARDLKISANFEVTLDTPQLVAEAVDKLLDKAGEDENITKVLLDFALEKTDDDKSWDISKDIAKAAELIFNENEAENVKFLRGKSLQDFLDFKKQLLKKREEYLFQIEKIATATLQFIDENGIQHNDFNRGLLPKHFQKLAVRDIYVGFNLQWQENIDEKPLYPARVSADIKSVMDSLASFFAIQLKESKKLIQKVWLINSILKNITPLSVINLVNQEIETIQKEKNILPVSRFNALINAEIKQQPAPFIYERLGEKYRHFFIDEFQDTSLLQWENLIPLIDNALSQQVNEEQGNLLLVGDAKQSIYRWRGGLPEQFMDLCEEKNPFLVSGVTVLNLETNYRSCKEIINFNNSFFTFLAHYFSTPAHKLLYEKGNVQKQNKKDGGYVKIEFIEKQKKADTQEVYCEKILETILLLKEENYEAADICILTRNRKDGILLGEYLMKNSIPVVSAETLLLQSSVTVQILVLTLTVITSPKNEEAKIILLDLLHDHFLIEEEEHTFFTEFLKLDSKGFSQKLKDYDIDFDFKNASSGSLFENCEYIIRQFKLDKSADAYLFGFMDLVYEFQQQSKADLVSFLDFWEIKKDIAGIAAGEGTNAVQIMTIHKAKGLEFPVVLFPFADLEVYKTMNAKLWYPLIDGDFSFEKARINYKNEIEDYSETGAEMFHNFRSTLELDNFNLLYVTLTRAVEKLYIFSEMPSANTETTHKVYSQFFMEFLKQKGRWQEGESIYEFGTFKEKSGSGKEEKFSQIIPEYGTTEPEKHLVNIVKKDAFLWGTQSEEAIIAGNLLHEIMEKIKSKGDIPWVFEEMEMRSVVSPDELNSLRKSVEAIVFHPHLATLFETESINEREIITSQGILLRPDRLVFHENKSVSIIDFKTGGPKETHDEQINSYALALNEMGFGISEKILIYSNGSEIMVNKV